MTNLKIAFRNVDTGQFVKNFYFAGNHVYKILYTDNLQEAWLYDKHYFDGRPKSIDKEETHMQYQLRWCKEMHNQNIEPLDVVISIAEKESEITEGKLLCFNGCEEPALENSDFCYNCYVRLRWY